MATDDLARDAAGPAVGRTITVVALVASVAAVIAATTLWLLLTDPVAIANAVETGEISPLAQQIAAAIYEALLGLFAYF
jgi:hypothetical protein